MDYEKVLGEHKFPTYEELKTGLLRLIDEGKISRKDAARLLPELRESEDERIRKRIYGLIYHNDALLDKDELLAWLEKQKYDRMKPIYDARESFESALEKAWNDYHNGYENVDKLEDDYVECAHAKGFREGYLFGVEKQKEQKPVEWSEEDEKMRRLLIAIMEKNPKGTVYSTGEFAQALKKGCVSVDEISGWLKSLRPSWKPSEEQMSMLRAVINDPNNSGAESCQLALRGIYEQLKKL